MQLQKKSIVFLGFSDFPYGLAEAQKIILISKSLLLSGNNVTVICRNGSYLIEEKSALKASGSYENIEYVYASGSCFRNERFFKRRLFEIKGKINELLLLNKRKKEKRLDYAILSTCSFSSIILYYLVGKILKFKLILNYVEFYSAIHKKKSDIFKRLNDKLFDTYAPSLSDGIFPISEFLINHLKKVAPSKNYLKIPGLTDFEKYDGIETLENKRYFLFCGNATYKEIILFIIDSFELLENNLMFLYLVINGSVNDMEEIKEYIGAKKQKEKIKIFTKLPEKELFTYYKNAIGLLIPLRPTFQDNARFPHKTGEYLASGNPVISTNYGEIKYYFKDKENMLLAESYDVTLFAEKMQFVIDNPAEAKEIGLEGKNLAFRLFDYRYKAKEINDFLTLGLKTKELNNSVSNLNLQDNKFTVNT
jgi:glycosyltransferase involved in cell wall biosynthesis